MNSAARRGWSQFLDPAQLIDFTRFFAREVAFGKYPFVRFDSDERWHQRIYRDPRVDVWLISWLPEQGTQLHDHGGSSGAFTVITGELTESLLTDGEIRRETRSGLESVGFGSQYIHDVQNLSTASAVSVHAYSAPLTSMNYYDLDGGNVVKIATLATDDPEPYLERAAS